MITEETIELAGRVARRVWAGLPPVFEFEDLRAAGLLGLVRAARSFDPGRRVPFGAYAAVRIRGEILDSIRRGSHGEHARGREDSVTVEQLDETHELQSESNPESNVHMREIGDVLHRALSRLSGRQRKIVRLYYFQGRSMAEIAGSMGVSVGRISQLHRDAIGMLRRDSRLLPMAA